MTSKKRLKTVLNNKAQASLEYMVNYVWIFLIIMGCVGVMAYFGMFNVQRYAAQHCSFDSNFYCNDFNIELDPASPDTFNMKILLQNNMNKEVVINQTNLTDQNNDEIICTNLDIYCRSDEIIPVAEANPSNVKVDTNNPDKWIPTRVCKLDFLKCNRKVYEGSKQEVNIKLNFSGINSTNTYFSHGVVYANAIVKT
ncbi:MAG: hypothetical protein KKF89_04610 [Nanoarchaeota archaeon]|nr:hypothetical protein [Nanoarchaeota archaeon]MBU1854976.1 hypothetical protein [Nanoarchaeota archaeon]